MVGEADGRYPRCRGDGGQWCSDELNRLRAELQAVRDALAKYGYVTDSPGPTVDTICEEKEANEAQMLDLRNRVTELEREAMENESAIEPTIERADKAEARVAELDGAIEWQRKDNLAQLRIFSEARDEAKHENRELKKVVERLRAIEHAIGRVIRVDAGSPLAAGDGVWVDLSSWEAVEDLMGGREVMYERYRKMLEADRALDDAEREVDSE